MSYTFDINEQAVWSPANRVAMLYVGMIEIVAAVLKKPTGLIDKYSGDWYEINPTIYTELVTEMLRNFAENNHPDFRTLLGSVLSVSIRVLDRAGIQIETRNEKEREAIVKLRAASF